MPIRSAIGFIVESEWRFWLGSSTKQALLVHECGHRGAVAERELPPARGNPDIFHSGMQALTLFPKYALLVLDYTFIVIPILNMGRYMETSTKATITPINRISAGSSALLICLIS